MATINMKNKTNVVGICKLLIKKNPQKQPITSSRYFVLSSVITPGRITPLRITTIYRNKCTPPINNVEKNTNKN